MRELRRGCCGSGVVESVGGASLDVGTGDGLLGGVSVYALIHGWLEYGVWCGVSVRRVGL